MSKPVLQSLFGHKAWANRELFELLAGVTAQEELHAMIRTLNHIYVVDRIFRAHLLGEAHGYAASNTKETPTLAELQAAVAQTDAWYLDYVAGLGPQALGETVQFRFTDGDAGSMTREEILHHIITHGGYHRGNVGQILKGIGVAPPRDLFTKYLRISA